MRESASRSRPAAEVEPKPPLTTGRTCGQCRACCKLPDIPELNKPINTWCRNTNTSEKSAGGCRIYESRPQVCREFACGWLSGLGQQSDRPDLLGVMWQPITLPSGEPGLAFVEYRPGALMSPRVQQLMAEWNRLKPGAIVVRRADEPRFRAIGITVERQALIEICNERAHHPAEVCDTQT